MKPTIRALFLDVGNVCITFDVQRFIKGLGRVVNVPTDAIEAVLLTKTGSSEKSRWTYSPLFAALECGEIELFGLYSILLRALDRTGRVDYYTFARLWSGIFIRENRALDRLLYKVPLPKYLLSNINKVVYERSIPRCRVAQHHVPDRRNHILSFEVGAIKPDPAISKAALARARVAPEESLFVDDVEENIAVWRALGGHGIVYNVQTDPIKKLRDQFRAYGVLK